MNWISVAVPVFFHAVIHFFVVGHLFSFGYIVGPLQPTLNLDPVQAASVGSVQVGLFHGLQFLSALAFSLLGHWGKHLFLAFGGVCWFAGIFSATYAQNFDQFIGVYGALAGVGASICFWTSLQMTMNLKLKTYPAIPVFIVIASGGAGEAIMSMVVSPYLTNDLSSAFGVTTVLWKSVLQLIALIGAGAILVSSLLLACTTACSQRGDLNEEQTPIFSLGPSGLVRVTDNKRVGDWALSKTIFCFNSSYWLVAVAILLTGFATEAPYIHLISYLSAAGMPIDQSRLVMMSLTICEVIGRFLPSLLCAPKVLPLFVAAVAWQTAVTALWMLVSSNLVSAIVFASLFGLGSGALTSLMHAVIQDYRFPNRNLAHLLLVPFSLAMAGGAIGGGFVFAALVALLGYTPSIAILCGFQGAALLASLGAWIAAPHSNSKMRVVPFDGEVTIEKDVES